MSQQIINIGAQPNDGLGDPIRTAFEKTNENFTELFNGGGGNGGNANTGNITFSNVTIGTQNLNPVIIQTNANGRLSSWNFNSTGSLSFPDSGLIDDNGGIFRVKSNGNAVQLGSNDDQNYVTVSVDNVIIQTQSDTTNLNWIFDNAGNLTTPGNLSVTGNIRGSYILGNGSQLTGIVVGSVNANSLVGTTLNSNITISSLTAVGTLTTLSVSGNTRTGNILTAGFVSATGNVTGNYILGNGALLTGITAGGGSDANALTGNTLSSNVTLSSLTRLGTLANLSISGNTTSGNYLTTGLISATGNVYGNAFITSGSGGGISASGNIQGGNILTGGLVSATGNITGNYILGNGSQLTGVAASSVNAAALTGNTLSSNVTISSLTSVGTLSTLSVSGNAQSGNILTGGLVSATGNVTGNYFIGNGSQLTGVAASSVNASALVGNTLSSNVVISSLTAVGTLTTLSVLGNTRSGNITTDGTILVGGITLSGNLIVGQGPTLTIDPNGAGGTDGNVVITGNLTVQGTTTTINSNTLTTNDLQVNMANNAANATAANNGGIGVGPAGSEYATLLYNTASNVWVASLGISSVGNISTRANVLATGNVTGNYIIGDGSLLTNINAGNITGAYGNANVANYLPTFSGNLTAGNVSATGNVQGSYILGNGSQLTGLPASYANSNVASFLATFGSNTISSTGTITTTANILGGNISTSGPGGTISGSGNIIAGNVLTTGLISATGNITGNYFVGNGSQLTGVAASSANAAALTGNTLSSNVVISSLTAVGTLATLSVNGNITSGNILFGANVISGTGTVRATSLVGTLANTNSKISIASNGNITFGIGSFGTTYVTIAPALLSVTGNIVANNLLTFANLAVSGGAPVSATDTTIAYKIPVLINGVTYYIALTAGQ